jgi:hypothetical protein
MFGTKTSLPYRLTVQNGCLRRGLPRTVQLSSPSADAARAVGLPLCRGGFVQAQPVVGDPLYHFGERHIRHLVHVAIDAQAVGFRLVP